MFNIANNGNKNDFKTLYEREKKRKMKEKN